MPTVTARKHNGTPVRLTQTKEPVGCVECNRRIARTRGGGYIWRSEDKSIILCLSCGPTDGG